MKFNPMQLNTAPASRRQQADRHVHSQLLPPPSRAQQTLLPAVLRAAAVASMATHHTQPSALEARNLTPRRKGESSHSLRAVGECPWHTCCPGVAWPLPRALAAEKAAPARGCLACRPLYHQRRCMLPPTLCALEGVAASFLGTAGRRLLVEHYAGVSPADDERAAPTGDEPGSRTRVAARRDGNCADARQRLSGRVASDVEWPGRVATVFVLVVLVRSGQGRLSHRPCPVVKAAVARTQWREGGLAAASPGLVELVTRSRRGGT